MEVFLEGKKERGNNFSKLNLIAVKLSQKIKKLETKGRFMIQKMRDDQSSIKE